MSILELGKLDNDYILFTKWKVNKDLTEFITSSNLKILNNDPNNFIVKGFSKDYSILLQIDIFNYKENNKIFHKPSTQPILPDGVFEINGLNNYDYEPVFKSRLHKKNILNNNTNNKKINKKNSNKITNPGYYTPLQLASFYNFPTHKNSTLLDGTGVKIGIIQLGGGYIISDLQKYLYDLGITSLLSNVSYKLIGNATNNPTDPASIEVVLDIEIILAIVPNATIIVYFAINDNNGFTSAISKAITDNCSIISISWGASEIYFDPSILDEYNAIFKTAVDKGINIFVAAGDNGSTDGTNSLSTDFPSSSPYVIACGGTYITTNNNIITSETVWNRITKGQQGGGTGGGISKYFSKPSYQNIPALTNQTFRCVPDYTANADPNSGYLIYLAGKYYIIGGTSAVAPLLSALCARITQANEKNIGFINNIIYPIASTICKDITQGNNSVPGFTKSYSTTTGFDKCSGNGVIIGNNLYNYILAIPNVNFSTNVTSGVLPLTVNFTDSSTNSPTSWLWNFDNSSISTLQNPQYVYSNIGIYNVSLNATNNNGTGELTKNNFIVVISPINFTCSQSLPLIKNKNIINFTNTTVGNYSPYKLFFGDNTSSINNTITSHKYKSSSSIKQYTVTLQGVYNGNNVTKSINIQIKNGILL